MRPATTIQSDNYCDDQESWREWKELLENNPADTAITTLYAVRIGLCSMVKSGQIETDTATKIFENLRSAVINSKELMEQSDNRKNMPSI